MSHKSIPRKLRETYKQIKPVLDEETTICYCETCGQVFHTEKGSVLFQAETQRIQPAWFNQVYIHWVKTNHRILLDDALYRFTGSPIDLVDHACSKLQMSKSDFRLRLKEQFNI